MRFADVWAPCNVTALRDLTPDIRELTLVPERGGIAPYAPGSHIGVSLLIDGQPQTRSYSLVGDSCDAYRVAVYRVPKSRGGSAAMWALTPGARLSISTPRSLIAMDWTRRTVCLVAGGIGITPMIGLATALKRRAIDVTLHYAAKSRAAAAYRDNLDDLLGARLRFLASDEGQRLDFTELFGGLPPDALAVLCGPLRMLEDARRVWTRLGRSPTDLRFETFGSSGLLPAEPFKVCVKGSDQIITVPVAMSMLDALHHAGVEVMSDCERGECGVCAIDVIAFDGEIDHRDVFFSDHQKREGRKICPCVSRAIGTVTIDSLYAPDFPGQSAQR